MKIDITQVPVIISTCNKSENIRRTNFLKPHLGRHGFSNVSTITGVEEKPYQIGALENVRRILSWNSTPFILMEDDAYLIQDNFYPVLEIPEDTDILYLGGALHAHKKFPIEGEGIILNKAYGFNLSLLAYSIVNPDYVRIYNMYSAHAILFLTDKGRDAYYQQITSNRAIPFDVAFSYIMKDYNVLMVRKPFFFQNDEHNDIFTYRVIYDQEGEILEAKKKHYED
jgi:hypothetical protein